MKVNRSNITKKLISCIGIIYACTIVVFTKDASIFLIVASFQFTFIEAHQAFVNTSQSLYFIFILCFSLISFSSIRFFSFFIPQNKQTISFNGFLDLIEYQYSILKRIRYILVKFTISTKGNNTKTHKIRLSFKSLNQNMLHLTFINLKKKYYENKKSIINLGITTM